ncbi:hypothetical protein C7999DRAFT_16178 [Corynascus novoguineensis]|uniref:Gpi-anchored protein n=1 Tax=Corynascus novoguineensis TaxID=1126955 RepID=A0AAN7CNY9_9PEZI|nr:hypothetical protein C7999DRAFT_16178 [Corynascus novoguineensis]
MRQSSHTRIPGCLLLVLAWASATSASMQPFQPVETAATIARRQQSCLADFFSCADQGPAFDGTCCQNGQRCALDDNNDPACCPTNAVCTGTAPASFVTPDPTTAASYVPNEYFSFPYVATSFANPGHCSAAISQCSANYEACTSQLAREDGSGGGGYAVTVVVPGGGGTTVTAGAGVSVDASAAASICNSLSSAACSGLEPSMCTRSGTAADGFYFGTGAGNPAARPTAPPAACAGLIGAVAAGVAGLGVL